MTGAAERVLAEAALAMGDLAGAEVRLDRADALQAAVGDPFDTAMVRAAQARLAAANGDRQAAGRHAAEALGLAHRLHIAHVRAAMEALLQAVPAEVARAGPGGGASR